MTISVRGARSAEFPVIREVLGAAFKHDEVDLWDNLAAHDASMTPERVIVAEGPDGEPVACTVYLPRRIRLADGRWVPGAIVTLVACRPDLQGKGYGGATVQGASEAMAREGLAVGILYGHPGYYPRFGYAPVLPHTNRTLKADKESAAAPLEEAGEADLPAVQALFEAHMTAFPCAVDRPAGRWAWSTRHDGGPRLLVLPDRQAYAAVGVHAKEGRLGVSEAGATSPEAGNRLLDSLIARARALDLAEVRIMLPPEHLLCRLAALRGAALQRFEAGPGMAVITRWAEVLPEGYTLEGTTLCHGGTPVLTAPTAALTQLALGYRSVHDLLLLPGVTLLQPEALAHLERAFPAATPHWSLEVFWH